MEVGATSTISAMMQELYARQDAPAQAPEAPSKVEAESEQISEIREGDGPGADPQDPDRGHNLDTTV